MRHSSARAALIYQHATQGPDEAIAADMGKLLRQARRSIRAAGERVRNSHRAHNGHAASNVPREDQLEGDPESRQTTWRPG